VHVFYYHILHNIPYAHPTHTSHTVHAPLYRGALVRHLQPSSRTQQTVAGWDPGAHTGNTGAAATTSQDTGLHALHFLQHELYREEGYAYGQGELVSEQLSAGSQMCSGARYINLRTTRHTCLLVLLCFIAMAVPRCGDAGALLC